MGSWGSQRTPSMPPFQISYENEISRIRWDQIIHLMIFMGNLKIMTRACMPRHARTRLFLTLSLYMIMHVLNKLSFSLPSIHVHIYLTPVKRNFYNITYPRFKALLAFRIKRKARNEGNILLVLIKQSR